MDNYNENQINHMISAYEGAVPKYHKGKHIADWYTCGNCGARTFDNIGDNYCRNCGYKIKWDNPRCLTGV